MEFVARYFLYYLIYSVLGYICEVIYVGICTKKIADRGYLYGPLCPIYGFGALIILLSLEWAYDYWWVVLILGILLTSTLEYLTSFFMEIIFHMRWWDYSDKFLNINGRICFTFSLFWGLLAIYLIRHFNIIVDKLIDKVKQKVPIKYLKALVIAGTVILAIDGILTALALKLFFARTVYTYDLSVVNKSKYISEYKRKEELGRILEIENKVFSDKKMLRTFPNLKLKAENRRTYLYGLYL